MWNVSAKNFTEAEGLELQSLSKSAYRLNSLRHVQLGYQSHARHKEDKVHEGIPGEELMYSNDY